MDLVVHQLNRRLLNGVSLASSTASDLVNIDKFSLYCIQFSWTGMSGTIVMEIEATCDNSQNTSAYVYSTISQFTLTGSSGDNMVNVEKAGYSSVRVRFTSTGGAGTVNAIMNAKIL